MTPTQSVETLLARLRAKEHRGRFMPGGGTIDAEGKGTMWGGEKIMEWRNPDGPAAAAEIERLTALQSIPEPLLDEGLVERLIFDARHAEQFSIAVARDLREAAAALSIPRLEVDRVTEKALRAARALLPVRTNMRISDAKLREIYLAMSSPSAPDGEDR